MNDFKKWIQIRKDLYLQIQKEVYHRLGEDTPELMQYHKAYEKEFLKTGQASSAEQLFVEIEKADIVLMGDFHALHQSQKAQMRVLRQIPLTRKIVLAVEFFEQKHQSQINAYLSGRLSERDFLKQIQWKDRWGFAWENYRPLIRWAQKNKIPVFGLNKQTSSRTLKTLQARDQFAAETLQKIAALHPQDLIFTIYGDLHLASDHLPSKIRKVLKHKKILRVFQNSEALYFKHLGTAEDHGVDLIQLSDGSFCLQSVPPWVKWQNYLMYLERVYDLELDEDDDYDDLEVVPLDYTDHVSRYVKLMSEELHLKCSADELSVYTAENSSFWSLVKKTYPLKTVQWIECQINQEVSFYLPEISCAYLARPTVNHAASLALKYLHAKVTGYKHILKPDSDSFASLIWVEAIGYFGSKMINHKRKTDTLIDLKASLSSKAPHDLGKEALQLALSQKMHELMVVSSSNAKSTLKKKPKKPESYVAAAKLLGGMMGERLYNGYRKGLVSRLTFDSFFRKNIEQDRFSAVYYDIVEWVESLPAPFRSKKEKL